MATVATPDVNNGATPPGSPPRDGLQTLTESGAQNLTLSGATSRTATQQRGSTSNRGRGRGSRGTSRSRSRGGTRLRGRVTTRSRGRGTIRSRGSSTPSRNDPSKGWTISATDCNTVMMEKEFTEMVIQKRARLFCSTAVDKMRLECAVRGMAPTRSGFLVLLSNGLLKQLVEWMNEFIRLKRLDEDVLHLADIYKYVSVLLLSHTTGFSFEKAVSVLRKAGSTAPSLEKIRFIADNILAYSPTGRGADGAIHWNAQRDQTRHLSEFEKLAFRETRKVFFSPLNLLATLYDDLYGTRAANNQVKMLSSRKADREGHSADAVADAFFRVVLAIRFRRRGEAQTESVQKLLTALMDGRGEEALNGCIVTADRGYGKESFMRILMEHDLGSGFVMPDHWLRVHPFVGLSFLNPARDDLQEEVLQASAETSNGLEGARENDEMGNAANSDGIVASNPLDSDTTAIGDSNGSFPQYDRRRAFVIDDAPSLGPEEFFATKSAASNGSRIGQRKITSVAVQEHGTEKFSKILRFMYTVPSVVRDSLNTWIAVPKTNMCMERTLFKARRSVQTEFPSLMTTAEESISHHCEVLTLAQRCADWFVLRQFRITGTNAGMVLMSSDRVRSELGLPPLQNRDERTTEEWFDLFYRGWFSSKVSTEPMMRGTANENAVLSALEAMSCVKVVFEVGMVAMKDARYLACSPDGIALLDIQSFEEWNTDEGGVTNTEGEVVVMASVEIKTRVSPTSLGEAVNLSSPDILRCEVGDETFKKYVPREHMAQVLHQLVVLRLRFAIYISAAETGILYTVVIRCSDATLRAFEDVLIAIASPTVKWAYETDALFPDYVRDDYREILGTRLKFWKMIDTHVKTKGCFLPLKLFKHAAQSFYSKTKAGVDGATQQRAILRSSTSHFKWEQKIVSQTIKTLAVNAFFGWRMFQRQDLLESPQTFRSLDSYRNLLNKVQATADFMFDVSKELLSYAATIQIEGSESKGPEDEFVAQEEVKRLIGLAHARKRKRLLFFNSREGTVLRLTVRGHTPKQGQLLYCVLCGQNKGQWRGHRSSYSCTLCAVNLCVRTYAGLRKSCWSLWHSNKELQLRTTPNPSPLLDEEIEDDNTDDEAVTGAIRSIPARRTRSRSREMGSSSERDIRRQRSS